MKKEEVLIGEDSTDLDVKKAFLEVLKSIDDNLYKIAQGLVSINTEQNKSCVELRRIATSLANLVVK